jgi:hypothetical protein
MPAADVVSAFQRLAGGNGHPDPGGAAAAISTVVDAIRPTARTGTAAAGTPADLLDALILLRWAQAELAVMEPALIRAARDAGVSWQALASTLGVASRQAAERRYLRLASSTTQEHDGTRDDRVRAERDRRAGHRAVAQWANDNTADLRRLAGQITALTDLGEAAGDDLDRLHHALADPDATALPHLLAHTHRHLTTRHPDLANQIESVTTRTEHIRRQTQQRRDNTHA